MENQQGPSVQHRALYSMLSGSLDGRGISGRVDTCICMAGSSCCPLLQTLSLIRSFGL